MALTTGVWIFVGGVLTAALSKILVEEIGAWCPWIVRNLIKLAVAWLPENQRARFAEEWQSHVNEVPGTVGKLLAAAGFLLAAHNISVTVRRSHLSKGWSQMVAQLQDSHSKAAAVVNAIRGDKALASNEDLKSMVDHLSSLLSKSKEHHNGLAAAVSSVRTTVAMLLDPRVIQEEFDEVSSRAAEISKLSSYIMERLGERRKI